MAELAHGLKIRAGWKREALVTTPTWPSASAALLQHILPTTDPRITPGVTLASQGDMLSGVGATLVDVVSLLPTISLPCAFQYEGFEELLVCALGYMAKRLPGDVLLPEPLVAGQVYRHLYEVDAGLSSTATWDAGSGFQMGELLTNQRKVRRGTFAMDLGHAVWEVLSTMIQRWTLSASSSGVQLQFDLGGYSLEMTAPVNTQASLEALLPPGAPSVLFQDLVVRVAPLSTVTPLDAGDELGVSSLIIDFDGALTQNAGPRTGLGPDEWERGSVPGITVSYTLPRHSQDIWQARCAAATDLMASFRFTGPAIGTTGQFYQYTFYCPHLATTQADLEGTGPQARGDSVRLQALPPTPMLTAAGFPVSHHPGPLQVELVNTVGVHPLL